MTSDSDDNLSSCTDTVVLYHDKKRGENQTETELEITAEPDRSV